jgi:hypothetical protein
MHDETGRTAAISWRRRRHAHSGGTPGPTHRPIPSRVRRKMAEFALE